MKQRMTNAKNEVSLSTFDDLNYLKDITEERQQQPEEPERDEEKFGLEDEDEEQKELLQDFDQKNQKV